MRFLITGSSGSFSGGSGSFQVVLGRSGWFLVVLGRSGSFQVFQTTIKSYCFSLRSVCNSIATHLGPKFIKFPQTREELKGAMTNFEEKFNIPCVGGCIDGTLYLLKCHLTTLMISTATK